MDYFVDLHYLVSHVDFIFNFAYKKSVGNFNFTSVYACLKKHTPSGYM